MTVNCQQSLVSRADI